MKEVYRLLLVSVFINIILIGGTMNMFVCAKNGGKMPYKVEHGNFSSDTHFTYHDFNEVNFPVFSDFLILDFDYGTIYYSLGDVFLLFGAIFLIILLINTVVSKIK